MSILNWMKSRGASTRGGAIRAISALLLCAAGAWGQATSTATITGLVTDEQGAAIPGADVKIADSATSHALTTTTNQAGRYVVVNVDPGTYVITVSKQGFATFQVNAQKIDVGSTTTINAKLTVGSTVTTVEVTASAGAELQTTNASVGNTLSANELMQLPNLGRDVATLAQFQPGTAPGGYTAGAFQDQNVYTLDGGNNSDDMAGNNTSYVTNFTGTGGTQTGGASSGIIPTPAESIEELKVSAFNQTADFSGSIGGQIQMVTKRGTNQYHGSAYGFYYATNIGAANTWANNHTPAAGLPYTPLPKNHRSRFGASLGGVMLPKVAGGKTFFFVNYEGSRFPNVQTYERTVPSLLLRAGVIQVADASGKFQPYNLNPTPVTVNGVTYQPAVCGTGACDPRSIGLNPIVNQIWQKYMPLPNEFLNSAGITNQDLYNTQGYLSTVRAPLTQNSYVVRIDHDFGDRNRFFATYRYSKVVNLTTNQVDIGGALNGDTLGTPAAVAPRPQLPSFWAIGLTSTISPSMTNDLRLSYTRNFWQWGSEADPPQLPGLGGAVEIGGESTNALIPYNVNTQSTRTRFWDGQDKTVKDDLTLIKGNHLVQFGGTYQRNFDYHQRTDNGQGINNNIVYQITSSNINFGNFQYPASVPTNQQSNFNTYYSYVTGMVSQSQLVYTRAGSNLALQPIGSSGYDKSVVPTYTFYAADTWHLRPSFTLTYGLSYGLEMPPYEEAGKQVSLVDSDNNQVVATDYFAQRQKSALAGQVYQPILGFATVRNIGSGLKYPYNPFYGGFSPRVSVAWNPKFTDGPMGTVFGNGKTVLRAGYGRIYGRLNGVNLLLVPLLPPGLLQAVSCIAPGTNGQCLLANGVDPSTAFRIGVDGLAAPLPGASPTLPQPYYPGIGSNPGASDVTFLDPHYRPERTDNLTVSLQREISRQVSLEVGYVGRLIRNELLAQNLDAVPYMTTLGGQTFANAFSQVFFATPQTGSLPSGFTATAQPFLEAALGGANSSYCQGYGNCTTAVIAKNTTSIRNTAVSDLWTALYKAPSWTLGRTMLSAPLGAGLPSQGYTYIANSSNGTGNYNAMFFTFHLRDFHGITGTSNFTWGRALGTGNTSQATSSNTAVDVFNINNNYGPQSYDYKFVYNSALYYAPKYFRAQKGVIGHVLGGWTFSPLFTAQSGAPINPGYSEGGCSGCEAFGEVSTTSSATVAFIEAAQGTGPYTGGSSAHYNNPGVNGVGTTNPTGINFFKDPSAVLGEFRKCVLGYDWNCSSYPLRGLPRWNLDLSVNKSVNIWKERVAADFSFQFTNVLNHVAMSNPTLTITTPSTFGRITSATNIPRQMEFGMRVHW